MAVPVRYACPRCGAIVTLSRAGSLADKSVTPFPLEGWTYAPVGGEYENADGVKIVCEEDGSEDGRTRRETPDAGQASDDGSAAAPPNASTESTASEGCGEPFYLNFVRYEEGTAVEPAPESERVELAPPGPRGPKTPDWPS